MDRPVVEILVAAAVDNVGGLPESRPLSYATWHQTRHDNEFEPNSAIRYLRSEGHDVNESLLHAYFDVHRKHNPFDLSGVTKIAPWIDCLDDAFVDYQSFRPLRETPRYSEIFTFTTPAWSEDEKLAFFELWTENGRYAQMGFWWWVQMRFTGSSWTLDWKNMHSLS